MDETLREDVEELEANGWEIDRPAQAAVMRRRFPSFAETVNYLIDLEKKLQSTPGAPPPEAAVPAIRIEGGTAVTVRLGRPPAPGITAAEIALAKALTAG